MEKTFGIFKIEKESLPIWLTSHDENEMMNRKRAEYELHPSVCNVCGSHNVVYTGNDMIYGKKYGNGWCYLCTDCYSFVGTHKNAPEIALGILADKDLRDLRKKCHTESERLYKPDLKIGRTKRRTALYFILGQWLKMSTEQMHFAKMEKADLEDALSFMRLVDFVEWNGNGFSSIKMKDGTIIRFPESKRKREYFESWVLETQKQAECLK